MKRKRKRSTILRAKLVTYMVAVLMLLVYIANGIATNDINAKLMTGAWTLAIVAGLMLYLNWQKLGTRIVLGASVVQGLALLALLSLYDLSPVAMVSGAMSYILPILGVGMMLRLLEDRSEPPEDTFVERDFARLREEHTDSVADDEQVYQEQNQIGRAHV